MKKIFTAMLLASMVLSFASCSSEKKDENSETPVQTTVSEQSADSGEAVMSDGEQSSDEEPAVTSVDYSKLKYDFKGLDTEECINILTSKRYYLKFRYNHVDQEMSQDLYYDNGKMYIVTRYMGAEYSVLYQNKTMYNISDDIYCKVAIDEQDDMGSADMFEGFAYVESGEMEVDGKICKYDEYYQTTTDSFTRMLLTEDKDVFAFQSGDKLMYIDEYSGDFDSDKKIAIPEGAKEVSEEEFNSLFLQKLIGSEETAAE